MAGKLLAALWLVAGLSTAHRHVHYGKAHAHKPPSSYMEVDGKAFKALIENADAAPGEMKKQRQKMKEKLQPGPLDPSRIIGSTTGTTDVQAIVVSRMLKPCKEIHWDGDSVSEGAFSSALGVGEHPFIEKDMADKYAEGILANPDRKAVAHCSRPNKAYCPSRYSGNPFQVMTDSQILKGASAITTAMGGDSWIPLLDTPQPELEFKGNSAQYLQLAAADIAAAPPKKIFWLYDDTRNPDTYPVWVSLAEWYAYCDKYVYKIVNHEGKTITPDTSKLPFSVTAVEMGWGTRDQKCQPKV